MKSFVTSGTGNEQTLSEIESDKIPVYDSVADAEADLANLAVGQIVATKDTGSELSAPVDTVQSGNMHAVTSNAVYNAIGRINILSNIIEFTSAYMNVPIEIPISIDVENETVLTFVIATDINQTNSNRLFTAPVMISKDCPSYFDFNELRDNTKIQAFIATYVLGSKKLYMTCFNGSLSTVDKYKIFAIIKG